MLDKLLSKVPVIAISLAVPLIVNASSTTSTSDTPLLGQIANFMGVGFLSSQTQDNTREQVKAIEDRKVNGNLGTKQPSRFDQDNFLVYLEADFLYWTARQDGLEYAVSSSSSTSTTLQDPQILLGGKLKDIDFDWGPGCKLKFGYHTPYDFWDLAANWTHFHIKTHTDTEVSSDGGLAATWLLFGEKAVSPPGFNISEAAARWHLNYDVLDILVSRNYFVSRAITLTPKLGFRTAWIDQVVKYRYVPLAPALHPEEVRLKNNFFGLGATAGLDLNFCFNQHWSLWGKVAGSLLAGFFKVNQVSDVGNSGIFAHIEDEQTNVATNLETGIGLQWETDFNHKNNHVVLFAGYEFLVWFSQNHLKNFFAAGFDDGFYFESKGDLNLKGLTAGIRFDF